MELNFSFDADINKAVAALDDALTKMAADPRVKPHLLAAPEIFGWNAVSDWAVIVRMRARVTAGKQGEVARVMRQYALEALNQAGVPVANPHRVMVQPAEASGAALGGGAVGGGAQAS